MPKGHLNSGLSVSITDFTPEEIKRFHRSFSTGSNAVCWEWTATKSATGYGSFFFKRFYRSYPANRVAYAIHNGALPSGLCVCHSCDNPGCVNPAHLFLGTLGENNTDRNNKGRTNDSRGERNNACKLKEEQVREIRTLLGKGGLSYKDLSKMFGVSPSQIGHIKTGFKWAHLT